MRTVLGTGALVLLWASVATAQQLGDAEQLFEAGSFEEARAAYAAGLETGELDRAGVTLANLRIGTIAAAYGDLETARAAFRRAVALDPTVAAPEMLAPDQREMFEALRSSVAPFALELVETGRDEQSVTVEARVVNGAEFGATGMILGRTDAPARATLATSDFGTALEFPVEAVARDRAGNGLASARLLVARPVSAPTEVENEALVSSVTSEEPTSRRGWKVALIVVAGVLAVGGAALAIGLATRREQVRYVVQAPDL